MDGETAPEGYIVEKTGECDVEDGTQNSNEIFRMPKKITLPMKQKNSDKVMKRNREFWRKTLSENNITKICAPMVDQSELAFRVFVRRYGAQITFTPMIHAHLFVNDGTYRRNSLALLPEDRPLIVQFCANKVDTFLDACRLIEDHCDGVDLNLGCPQMVAKRGRYGSWLQDEVDLICEMVKAVSEHCKAPVSCKIRVRNDREETIRYAKRLVDAGATMLTVHGRTREMKGADTGIADWTRIRDIVEAVDVPVIANGNIQFPGDVERCMAVTGAVGVMSAEGLLYNPLLFHDENAHIRTWKIAKEYLECARKYNAGTSAIRAHVFRICHHSLLEYEDLRMRVSLEHRLEDFENIVEELERRCEEDARGEEAQQREINALEMFRRIRNGEPMNALEVSKQPHWISKPYFRLSEVAKESIVAEGEKTFREKQKERIAQKAQEMGVSLKQARKRERRVLNGKRILEAKKVKFPPCVRCKQPAGKDCRHQKCKKCCRFYCKTTKVDCKNHRYIFSIESSEVNSINS